MKDIYKKIFISLSAFILVLSFSFTHLNTSKRFEVQASEYSITTQVSAVIAVFMAALGIQLVNEPTLNQMQDIYDNLSIEAQGVLSSPTLGNNIVNDMIALPYSQAQSVIHSLVNSFEAWNWTGEKFYNNGSIVDVNLPKLVYESTLNTSNGNALSIIRKIYKYNNYPYWAEKITKANNLWLGQSYANGLAIGYTDESFVIDLVYGVYLGSAFHSTHQSGLKASSYYVGALMNCTSSGSFCDYWNGNIFKPHNQKTGKFNIIEVLPEEANAFISLMIGAAGLTLPAPTTGWDNSGSGDVDLDGWTKGLNIPDVGDVVVLGGLAAGTLAGLSPETVLVPSGSQTPFDPSEDPDPGDVDLYTPPNNNGSIFFDVIKALAATFGLSLLLEADPVGNVINASQTFLDNIVQTITQSFSTMLQALIQPFDIPSTQLKIEGIRSAIFARIPCVEETLNAWYQIMAVNGSNLISSFTFFGETFSISSGQLLEAFRAFGNLIQQAFRFVFWFIFLKGMRRRVTSFLGLVSAER